MIVLDSSPPPPSSKWQIKTFSLKTVAEPFFQDWLCEISITIKISLNKCFSCEKYIIYTFLKSHNVKNTFVVFQGHCSKTDSFNLFFLLKHLVAVIIYFVFTSSLCLILQPYQLRAEAQVLTDCLNTTHTHHVWSILQ